MNEISKMKKREMFILNCKDPDDISGIKLEYFDGESKKK